ncbi:uncharacterized protein E0L32_004341 [Thyridium curvatum]|uniref:Uncharacterized protein n=1 Tax=Thyridium curvatum TaxID=1093900 RepID=A0A507B7H3_9PEZI|nr:uncharacterized protein E0L32_004341 [Thyridium curvatum]TPX15643.1 hypothetical protein E0L32_004341 [Thyridium curvatum]
MSQFVTDLWESIFTPGATPTLLIATNVSFAALQLVLFALLLATWSVHFVILSFLCGGLWWAINWFANEVRIFQEREEQEKRSKAGAAADADNEASSSSSAEETEVETVIARGRPPVTGSKEVEPLQKKGELKRRTAEAASEQSVGSKSSASTEDEWEKVSENEKDK